MQIKNIRISEKLNATLEEDLQYRADELVDLGEEILMQVSALGVCLYLKEGKDAQKEQFNDFILNNLFFNEKHQNAGPVFKMVMQMLAGIKDTQNPLIQLFQHGNELNDTLIGLQLFRNSLMHGFFVLPAEVNQIQTDNVCNLLEKLAANGFFDFKEDYHFWNQDGYTGNWNISRLEDWRKLQSDSSFGKLAERAIFELYDPSFTKIENAIAETGENTEKIKGILEQDLKGSVVAFFHPADKENQEKFFKSTYALLQQKKNALTLAYEIHEDGIAHSSSLLLKYLDELLTGDSKEKNIRKRIEKHRKNENNADKSVFLLVNNIHTALYSPDHLTLLVPFLVENNIHLIGIGYEYEHLIQYFNHLADFRSNKNLIPDDSFKKYLIHNQLRHRGPYKGETAYEELCAEVDNICARLKNKNNVIARRYSDEQNIGLEIVEEVFSILYPCFKYEQKIHKFLSDKIHELYEYPTEITETSSIFLIMGRRDIRLEYTHKSLVV